MQEYDPIDKPLSTKDVDDKLNEVFEIAPNVEKLPTEKVSPPKQIKMTLILTFNIHEKIFIIL